MIKHDNLPQNTIRLNDVYPTNYFYYDKIEGIGPYFMVCSYYLQLESGGYTTKKAVLDIANSKIYDIGDGENYKFNGKELVFKYDSIEFDIDNVSRDTNYATTWDTYTVGNILFVDGYLYFSAIHTFDNTDTKFVVSTTSGSYGHIYVLKEKEPEPPTPPDPSDDGTNELITDGSDTGTTTNDEPTTDPTHNPADYNMNYKVPVSIYQYDNGKIILTR